MLCRKLHLNNLIKSKFYILHFTFYILFFLPILAQAQLFGLTKTAEKAGLKPVGEEPAIGGPAEFAGQLVGAILAFVGVLFFLLVLYGGARWMFARGNAEEVKKAQEIIKTALLGMIIIFLAYILTRFVLTLITGAIR